MDLVCVDNFLNDVGFWPQDLYLFSLFYQLLFDEIPVLNLLFDNISDVSVNNFLLDFNGFLHINCMDFWFGFSLVQYHLFLNNLRDLQNILNDFPNLNCPLLHQLDRLLIFVREDNFPVMYLHIMDCQKPLDNLLDNHWDLSLHNDFHWNSSLHSHLPDDFGLLLHYHDFLFLDWLVNDFLNWVGNLFLNNLFDLVSQVDWCRLLNLHDF